MGLGDRVSCCLALAGGSGAAAAGAEHERTPVCLELRGGMGGAFRSRHSSFTCQRDERRIINTLS